MIGRMKIIIVSRPTNCPSSAGRYLPSEQLFAFLQAL
jgi:hypothetical protein